MFPSDGRASDLLLCWNLWAKNELSDGELVLPVPASTKSGSPCHSRDPRSSLKNENPKNGLMLRTRLRRASFPQDFLRHEQETLKALREPARFFQVPETGTPWLSRNCSCCHHYSSMEGINLKNERSINLGLR